MDGAGDGAAVSAETRTMLLALHDASAALQVAHAAAVDAGDTRLVNRIRAVAADVANAVGAIVVREGQRVQS